MTFADPRWLAGLAVVAVLALLEAWSWVRAARALARLTGDRREHALLLQRRPGDRRISTLLRLTACALLVVGAAGPEWGREVVRRTANGSDIVMVMDVSASMDARDVAPSRIEEARREALAVLDRLEGSRVGVVAFAGDAIRLCPLTLDIGAARLVIESLNTSSVSTPGTDLGRALRMALRVAPAGRRDEQAIVLWTDGEDLEQGARAALGEVAASGVRVFAVGVGTRGGDVVPVLDEQGRAIDVKRDDAGALVKSRLDEDLLRTIGARSRGGYFSASAPGGETPRLVAALSSLARSSHGSRLSERPVARFRLCAALAALLLAFELGRARRRQEAEREAGTPLHSEGRAAAAALLAALLVAGLGLAQTTPAQAQSAWARGDRAFRAGRWGAAETLYTQRLAHGGPAAVRVNLATTRAKAGDASRAVTELGQLAAPDTPAGHTAGYNQGTLLGEADQIDPAMAALRQELERDPGDRDARWNYEILLRRKQQQQQSPKPPPKSGQSGGGGGGGGQAQTPPQPKGGGQAPQPQPQPSPGGPQPANAGSRSGMSRAEADRLLGALEELSRQEQERQRHVKVKSNEVRRRDW